MCSYVYDCMAYLFPLSTYIEIFVTMLSINNSNLVVSTTKTRMRHIDDVKLLL